MDGRRGRRDGWRWAQAARVGLAAWLVGNVYEAVVGVPQLLAAARPRRSPGLLSPGSPVRFYAPVAPLALGATGVTLVTVWRSGVDRRLTMVAGGSVAAALGVSAHLIQVVNWPLLGGAGTLSEAEQRRLVAAWHRGNAVRLAALTAASAALSRLASRGR